MGNNLNTNILDYEEWQSLNENLKFPNKGKLIVPISKLIIEVCEKWDCYGAGSYEASLDVAKDFLTKYPIIFSLTKKCYWVLLHVYEDEVAYLICKFIKYNTPKKYIDWNYGKFKFKRKFNSFYCSRKRIEKMNEIFTKSNLF